MVIKAREVCPNCISLTEVSEETKVIREEEIYLVERVTAYCRYCNQELINTINLRFKHKMG
jgi:hypothetical protein